MDLNNILFQIFTMVLVTSLSGSLMVLIWLGLGLFLEKSGYWHIFNCGIRITVLIAGLPLTYPVLYWLENTFYLWGGVLFQPTPAIRRIVLVFGFLWLAGLIISAEGYILAGILAYKYYCKRIPHGNDWDNMCMDICRRLQIRRKIPVYGCYETKVPMIRGWIRPMIILPEDNYSDSELRVILTHELVHYRHRDLWLKAIFTFTLCLQWFNPLAARIYEKFCFLCECYCDDSAAAEIGSVSDYFAVILAIAKKQQYDQIPVGETCLLGEDHELLWRVKHMAKMKSMKKAPKWASAAMCAGLIFLSTGSAFASSGIMAEGYHKLYYATVEDEVTVSDSAEQWLESEDFGPAEGIIVVSETPGGARAKANGTFEWSVPNNVQKQSDSFYVEKGKTISASAVIDPVDKSIKFGVIKTDGARTYVIGSDTLTKSYTAEKSGYYRIFVENTSGVTVDVYGSYSTR